MRRAALVLFLGLVIAVPAASTRSATDWKTLKYFDDVSQQLVVATGAGWTGGRVLVTPPNQRPLSISGPGLRSTSPRWLWATTCGSPAQFVSFSRQIAAPGVPTEASLDFVLGFGRELPFRSGAFLVNGAEVARIKVPPGKFSGFPKSFSGPLPPAALKAFRYGVNTLTVRADRNALPKGQRCNSPNRLVGVVASLKLRFRPDLVAVPSSFGAEQVVRAAAGEVKSALGTISFRNAGPSGSTGGKFIFSWVASGELETAFSGDSFLAGTFLRNCKGGGLRSGTVECEYADLPAGKSGSVNVIGGVKAGPKFGPASSGDLSMSWQILPAGGDVNGGNNAAGHKFIVCGSSSSDPRCKK